MKIITIILAMATLIGGVASGGIGGIFISLIALAVIYMIGATNDG